MKILCWFTLLAVVVSVSTEGSGLDPEWSGLDDSNIEYYDYDGSGSGSDSDYGFGPSDWIPGDDFANGQALWESWLKLKENGIQGYPDPACVDCAVDGYGSPDDEGTISKGYFDPANRDDYSRQAEGCQSPQCQYNNAGFWCCGYFPESMCFDGSTCDPGQVCSEGRCNYEKYYYPDRYGKAGYGVPEDDSGDYSAYDYADNEGMQGWGVMPEHGSGDYPAYD